MRIATTAAQVHALIDASVVATWLPCRRCLIAKQYGSTGRRGTSPTLSSALLAESGTTCHLRAARQRRSSTAHLLGGAGGSELNGGRALHVATLYTCTHCAHASPWGNGVQQCVASGVLVAAVATVGWSSGQVEQWSRSLPSMQRALRGLAKRSKSRCTPYALQTNPLRQSLNPWAAKSPYGSLHARGWPPSSSQPLLATLAQSLTQVT